MMRVILAVASGLSLTSCASVERVKKLETRVVMTETGLAAQGYRLNGINTSLRNMNDNMTRLEGRVSISEGRVGVLETGAAALRASDAVLSRRVTALERYISWSGRFTVTIDPSQHWQVLYANSTGESQKLRLRRTSGAGPVRVRIGEISRIAEGDPGGISTGVAPPVWDITGTGSQRWLRLGCGQELSGQAETGPASLEILVSRDPNPVKC